VETNTQIHRHRKCGAMIEIRQPDSHPLCGVRCNLLLERTTCDAPYSMV
jgi:hypothetical protein